MPFKRFMPDGMFRRLVAMRRRVHRWPELAFKEHRTAAAISKYLDRLGLPHTKGLAGTGIVARLDSGDPSAPTIALRADIDALPIPEHTGLPFASRVDGVMHACGHDGHIAILLGAAELLKKKPPAGNVRFIFQPAEEGGGGARRMIEEGVLEGVDMIFAGHIESHFQLGEVAMRRSIETSYTDELEITIHGKGGHAARPHETVDAILVASLFVLQLQTIISRGINPLDPTVISIGCLRAGSAFNAIADEAVLKGTVRNTDARTRQHVLQRIRKTAETLAALHDARIDVTINEGYPPVVNHPDATAIVRVVGRDLIGEDRVINLAKPSMGGEDFAYYLENVPGCLMRFGAAMKGGGIHQQHSSTFVFDEDVIRVGAAMFRGIVDRAIEHVRQTKGGAA